ncbi:MAG TPA: RTX toxin, partial [Myxococcaceae bacterium]|nr:RTX toxin [Myxococcaceae bacterium]
MKALWTTALVLTAIGLSATGCNAWPTGLQQAEDRTSASFAITPESIEPVLAASRPRSLSALSSAPASFVDVASVRIDVKEKETGEFLHTDFELSPLSESWPGPLPQLPCGTRLTFHARAFDTRDTLLFSSTTDQTLDAVGGETEDVVVSLGPPHQDAPIPLPRIKKVFAPGVFEWGEPRNVSFTVQGTVGEELTYHILPAPGGGTFDPSSGTLTLEATTATFVSRYNPPWVEGMTHLDHQVEVRNASGHSVTTTFRTRVKPSGKGTVQDTQLGVLINPVINHLTAGRISGTGNILWRAEVADDGPSSALSYVWSFTPDGTFHPAPAFTGDTNPPTLQHYTPAVRGTLK